MRRIVSPTLAPVFLSRLPMYKSTDRASLPPADMSSFETFRVVRHKHCLPGPRVLLADSYRGITGDTNATTRKLGPLGLDFTKASLGVSPPLSQALLGCGVGVAWGFGLRQGIHSTMLQTRALRWLRQEKRTLRALSRPESNGAEHGALLAYNHHARAEGEVRRFFGGFAASAAAAGIGLGWLFRTISAGGHAPALAHAATPILSTFFPVLALSNAGLAASETWACGKTFTASRRAGRAHWPRVLGHEQEVKDLLHARHIERRWVHLGNAVTHAMVAVGAPLTFFGGPYGLAVLVPGVFANIAVDVVDQRIVRYPRQLNLGQQLRVGDNAALGQEIINAQAHYCMLHRLRRERYKMYPRGLGISVLRPFARGVRAMRRWVHPKSVVAMARAEPTLARIAAEKHDIDRSQWANSWRLHSMGHPTATDLTSLHEQLAAYHPQVWQQGARQSLPALYGLLHATALSTPFAKAVLEDKFVRRRLAKQGTFDILRLQPKRWSINVRALLTQPAAADDPKLARRLLAHGEEVLLVQGKNAAMYRRRQLLDMLDARMAQPPLDG